MGRALIAKDRAVAGFIGLLPAEPENLAVDRGDSPEDLHLTLALWDSDGPTAEEVAAALDFPGPLVSDVFGDAVFNPTGDEPATVLLVQGEHLADAQGHAAEVGGWESDYRWTPHITLGYGIGRLTDEEVADRVGPVTFDRLLITVDDETVEVALTDEPAEEVDEEVELVAASLYSAAWEGVLAVENVPTGDGRMFESGALRWGDLPIPLRDTYEDNGGHDGAVVVGTIDEVWREGNEIRGRGIIDRSFDAGRDAWDRLESGLKRGVSVDLDDVDMEVRIPIERFEETDGMSEPEPPQINDDGTVTLPDWGTQDEILLTTDARLRAATLVDIPAFVEAELAPSDEQPEDVEPPELTEVVEGLAASSAERRPPLAWFQPPNFAADDDRLVSGPNGETGCPLTVTDDGRVYGHLALWASCHTAFPSECVSPPTSDTDYAYFRVGAVKTSEGKEVPTGRLTVDTLHAARRASATATLSHYENTGAAVADVTAGEDEYGIWVAGAVRESATRDQIDALRSSPLSGDWRRIGGNLELVAALAVNSPGFPVPRAMVAGGTVTSLQRSSMLAPAEGVPDDTDRILARMIERERKAEQARAAAATDARRRVMVASAASRIQGAR